MVNVGLLLEKLKELYHYREIIGTLASREIKSRYKQSVIGIFWAIIQPFSLMIIFTLVFDIFFKINKNGNIPYPIFVYSALVPWLFFSKSIVNSSQILVNNTSLVTKIYFPKEILPLSIILANMFDFMIASVILLGMMIFYKTGISINIFYILPLFLVELIFIIAVSLFISAANVFLRDIENGINLVIQLWMYATPVIYSSNMIPNKYLPFYYILNPISPVIDGFRKVLAESSHPDNYYVFISFIISVFLLLITYIYFKKAELYFSDVI